MKTKSTFQTFTRNTILLAITALALSVSCDSRADQQCHQDTPTNWIHTGTGDWFVSSNWSNGVPICLSPTTIQGGTAQISTQAQTGHACETFLGYDSGTSGNLSVDHGILDTCNELHVGERGTGKLNITNGGIVSTTFGADIGAMAGSNGAATVDGENQDGTKSQWTISGAGAGNLYVGGTINGAGGTGLLTVTNSASVTAASIHVYPSGTLTGNSTVSTTNGIIVDGTISRIVGTLTIGGDLRFRGQRGSTAACQ
jgi:fibronectin-binding autotransporter adhesin